MTIFDTFAKIAAPTALCAAFCANVQAATNQAEAPAPAKAAESSRNATRLPPELLELAKQEPIESSKADYYKLTPGHIRFPLHAISNETEQKVLVEPEAAAVETSGALAASSAEAEYDSQKPMRKAQIGAIADGISTWASIGSGAYSLNALTPTSPTSILGMTALKLGSIVWADGLDEHERYEKMKFWTASFGGATVNNLAALLGATGAGALALGVAGGYYLWKNPDAPPPPNVLERVGNFIQKVEPGVQSASH